MKLASYENGSRDGRLVLVTRDLSRAAFADDVAPNLLAALEAWDSVSAVLVQRYEELNVGSLAGSFSFDPKAAAAPLPRAPQWLDGSAFPTHGERMVKAFDLDSKGLGLDFPLMYQGMSDGFLGAHADMPVVTEAHGIDCEAELVAIVGDVAMGSSAESSASRIRLLALVDDVSLRGLLFREMSLGFGMIQCKPTCVFSPVCVTPDELGPAWQDGRMHLDMIVKINGEPLGRLGGGEMGFSFGQLIAHAAATRKLSAGTIVGSGTFSNANTSRGVACRSELRALEKMEHGAPRTPWLRFGERVQIEVLDAEGNSIFGRIDHSFVPAAVS